MSAIEIVVAVVFGVPFVTLCAMIVGFACAMQKQEVKANG